MKKKMEFEINEKLWKRFEAKCRKNGKTPDEVLEARMKEFLDGVKPIAVFRSKITR